MRWSKSFIPTLKENPKQAEATSHKLMLRAGLIRKLSSGIYSYLPLGQRVLNKVINIVREEMNASGAQEVLLPALQPQELWETSGRYRLLINDILITYKDRHGRKMVLAPTHEEVITNLIAGEIKSYKQLPQILYQIQTKFRDEPRPRFGIIRSCEFIMKDAYSFNKDFECLDKSYKTMHDTYCRVFDRCRLNYIVVEADPGVMGGDVSHEFMVPAKYGEDVIVTCRECRYGASIEVAEYTSSKLEARSSKLEALKPIEEVDTPGLTTVEEVSKFLKIEPNQLIKTLIYIVNGKEIAVLVRGDCQLNEAKLKKALGTEQMEMADSAVIKRITNAPVGFTGPVDLKNIKIIADCLMKNMHNFVTGSNKKDKHLINVNFNRDFQINSFYDLCYITDKEPCPKCGGKLEIKNAIEVGHIFKLGDKYSKTLRATFLDEDMKGKPIIMGCYGIGINRIIASCIETSCDRDGIIWPLSLSPYQVIILPLSIKGECMHLAEKIYEDLHKGGIEVLIDDRDESAGIKFKDADLIGIPIKIIMGEKRLGEGKVEIEIRKEKKILVIDKKDLIGKIEKLLGSQKTK